MSLSTDPDNQAMHPTLRRPRIIGPALGALIQAVVFTLCAQAALWLLDLWWAPIYTLVPAVVCFALIEVVQQRETVRSLRPAALLVSRLAGALDQPQVGRLRGLPVLRGRLQGRGVAVHFEPAGRTATGVRALRLGLTVAGLAPAAMWLCSDLPEDAPTRVESRLRSKHRHQSVTLPADAPAQLRALSAEPERAAEVLAEPGLMARLAPVLLANAPCAAVLEMAGDTARFDTRLTACTQPEAVLATLNLLVNWLPDPRTLHEDEDEATAIEALKAVLAGDDEPAAGALSRSGLGGDHS